MKKTFTQYREITLNKTIVTTALGRLMYDFLAQQYYKMLFHHKIRFDQQHTFTCQCVTQRKNIDMITYKYKYTLTIESNEHDT